jgi:DNA-directed RNA polymerase subunit beta'
LARYVPTAGEKFGAISIRIASPDDIRRWSRGEVKKPETINYRTFKPEKDGLFCERIFGPVKDWECSCGKYRKVKHRGITCDRCGVEITESKVRRERLGHINLAVPVTHIWFFKSGPGCLSSLVDLSVRVLERIIYFEERVVVDPGDTPLQEKQRLTEGEYQEAREEYGDGFVAKMGAEAIKELLEKIDLDALAVELRAEYAEATSVQRRKKANKRLKVVEALRQSGNNPSWMVLEVIPVIPPDLRPLVPLEGGRYATSDLNDLYRRVINRNNRLKRLIELRAPEVILRNEKRMLQEAVDALFDNGRHGRTVLGTGSRPLKSLSDMLKGKQGRFRQNLLGKRVDYSGRSVIVVGPELKLDECGLPKPMALELFEPFIIRELKERGIATTIKAAKKAIASGRPEVWDILEDVIAEHPVLLNRAPTLHRLGIQAFQPVLVEGKAIRIHPLVCAAFNADFDGDQMAVHVPLFPAAQLEARLLMMATNNIFSPSNGRPIATPSQDIVLGIAYLTRAAKGAKGEGKVFVRECDAVLAYESGAVDIHAPVKLHLGGELVDTTVGRIIFHDSLPPEVALSQVNHEMNGDDLRDLVAWAFKQLEHDKMVELLDDLKTVGFKYATLAGISIAMDDMLIPDEKQEFIELAREQVAEIEEQYQNGLITEGERYNKIVDVWTRCTGQVTDTMLEQLAVDNRGFNGIYMMFNSGARGSRQQIRQLSGMRGLMAKPSGEIIESPILSNFREGLSVLEYFISSHGARKGLADTALKTADAGYLTRRLIDVAQDVIIDEEDCGTLNGVTVEALVEGGEEVESLQDRIVGRVALEDIRVPGVSKKVIVRANEEVTEETAEEIVKYGIDRVRIRSVLTCESKRGTCIRCYGRNLATGSPVQLGEAVGIIAAQSIGEPGTQLTMRTFHVGGVASGPLEQSRIDAKNTGKVEYRDLETAVNRKGERVVISRGAEVGVVDAKGRELERYPAPAGATIHYEDGQSVKKKGVLLRWDPFIRSIITETKGTVKYEDIVEDVTVREETDPTTGVIERVIIPHKEDLHPQLSIIGRKKNVLAFYPIPSGAHIVVKDGEKIEAGDVLAKTPRQISKTKDITGGLPRVAELFEGRKPKEPAVISHIDGVVELSSSGRGTRKIKIVPKVGKEREYTIPHGKHLNVHTGDRVVAGQRLIDGPIVPQDILKVSGEEVLRKYLLDEIQGVYRLQGVKINAKHIEIIIRQMLRKVRIESPGDTTFLVNEEIDKVAFREENERVIAEGGEPATAEPLLLGITKASLGTESFIAAASFQQTTRVLTDAAMRGKEDYLRGLKENVIIGHLIPAGTGSEHYRDTVVLVGEPEEAEPGVSAEEEEVGAEEEAVA